MCVKEFPIILLSALSVVCAEPIANDSLPAEAQESSIELAEMESVDKGIKQLLRTNPFEYDCVENAQAWSDDEFFQRLEAAMLEDMRGFVSGFLSDQNYLAEYGAEQAAKDAEKCYELLSRSVQSARKAYDASLAWYEADFVFTQYVEGSYQEMRGYFANALRSRLLLDLHILGTDGICHWFESIKENPELGSLADLGISEFDYALQRRGVFSTGDSIEANNMVIERLNERLAGDRRFISEKLYVAYPTDSDSQKQQLNLACSAFLAAETAWDDYRKAICSTQFPVKNSFYGGSGTPVWAGQLSVSMRLSQLRYLAIVAGLANGGGASFPTLIDFSQYEWDGTEEDFEGEEQED